MTDKKEYDKKYEESIKNHLYFIAQNLPDELSIDSAYHFPGYDFDIVLKHQDFENGYALSSYRVKDRIENETLVDWVKNMQKQFEKHQSSDPPKKRRKRESDGTVSRARKKFMRQMCYNELDDNELFKMDRTDETLWVKDKTLSGINNAHEYENKDNQIYVNPVETIH